MSENSPVPGEPNEAPWRAGLRSLRALVLPGLILQSVAVLVVVAYYKVPSFTAFFERLAKAQASGGYLSSALTTALCGGLIPFLFIRLYPALRAKNPWSDLPFFLVYWAWKGAEVDLLYRSLGWLYGERGTWQIVACKVVTDIFGYNPLYATPVSVVCFAWKDAGYRWAPVAADIRTGGWYRRKVLPVLFAVWYLWIPVTSCTYSLPSALQIPLFNLVLCFWSLLFVHVTNRAEK